MTREEMQDERQEQEALKSAKEIVKKKSKDKVRKIVWNAVKAAIIPMLILMAKIFAVAILVCAVFSAFYSVLDGLNITSEEMQADMSDIQNFIEYYDSENDILKQVMLANSYDIYLWQNGSGYSALFLITVAFEQDVSAIEFNNFIYDMQTRAAIWQINRIYHSRGNSE